MVQIGIMPLGKKDQVPRKLRVAVQSLDAFDNVPHVHFKHFIRDHDLISDKARTGCRECVNHLV